MSCDFVSGRMSQLMPPPSVLGVSQHLCNTFMLVACLSVAKHLTKQQKKGFVLAHGLRVYSIVVGEDTAAKM